MSLISGLYDGPRSNSSPMDAHHHICAVLYQLCADALSSQQAGNMTAPHTVDRDSSQARLYKWLPI